ncbi:MAG TPA: DUF4198 domain-containing protein [Solimonas sp.]|nr:DUF4198 domain-containing protein [Solimonas sp.]
MKTFFRACIAVLAALLPFAAHAHKAFLVPSSTVLTESDHEVTVDAAISNDLFYFNHAPLRLDDLQITAPDGSAVTPENVVSGRFRSVFDVPLAQAGTYRIASATSGMFASWQGDDGKPRRWRGSEAAFKTEVPADAKNLRVTQMANRVETFVTVGKPSVGALATTGVGLELLPVTHPNDLFSGEKATFKLLLDGKPAAGLTVTATPGGTRYRDRQDTIETTTDADGAFSIVWPQPGLYWLHASQGGGREEPDAAPAKNARAGKNAEPQARPRRVGYSATLEVLP